MSKTLAISIGSYGGFYLCRGHISTRLCLGWIAFDLFHVELDQIFLSMIATHKAEMEGIKR
jgi:hypothetical protein